MDIISEIMKLPNLGYDYWKDDGQRKIVILGSSSCPPSDDYLFAQNICSYNVEITKAYETKPLSEEAKSTIAYYMRKMINACDTRMSGTYTPAQQASYIDALSPDERAQIEEQVIMFKECNTIYRDSCRRW